MDTTGSSMPVMKELTAKNDFSCMINALRIRKSCGYRGFLVLLSSMIVFATAIVIVPLQIQMGFNRDSFLWKQTEGPWANVIQFSQ